MIGGFVVVGCFQGLALGFAAPTDIHGEMPVRVPWWLFISSVQIERSVKVKEVSNAIRTKVHVR